MNLEFKKRLMTTLLLIPSMILMYINSYFFILAIFMISMIAILEFIKLMSQIFKKKSYLILFFSIVASIYILLFSIIFYDLNTLSEVNNLNSLKRYIWYMLLI